MTARLPSILRIAGDVVPGTTAVGAIGVDPERMRPDPGVQAVARYTMSPLEWMLFNELPAARCLQAFTVAEVQGG